MLWPTVGSRTAKEQNRTMAASARIWLSGYWLWLGGLAGTDAVCACV